MKTQSVRRFTTVAFATSLLTLGLIVFGAVVRVTDSGLGCGNEWPLCNGTIFPPLDNLTAWIEWMHRLFAVLIGVMGLGALVLAIQGYRTQNQLVLVATVAAALLYALQSALGAIVVIFDLPPTMVTLHLGTAMLLLGALLWATMRSWYVPASRYQRDHVTLLAYITTGLSLLIILTGALVRGAGATLACGDWPLCDNAAFSIFGQNQLQLVHMTHRFAVVALGFVLVLLMWYVWRTRPNANPLTRQLVVGAMVAYVLQAAVGAMYVISSAAVIWGAAHVGLAALTWGLLVCFSVVETMNSQNAAQSSASRSPSAF